MDFDFTEEQKAVQELAAQLFAAHGSDAQVRALAEAGLRFDAGLWKQLGETGLLALSLPEEHGGSGMGMLALALVLEQQGRHLAAAPLWQQQLASLAIAVHGEASLRRRLLPALASGEQLATPATEMECGEGLHAERSGTGWLLRGELPAVLMEAEHGWLLVPARQQPFDRLRANGYPSQQPFDTLRENGHSSKPAFDKQSGNEPSIAQDTPCLRLFVLPADAPGLRKTHGVLTNGANLCDLFFDGVYLPADAVLAEPAADWISPRLALCISALQLGVVQEALARSAAYTTERHQFGRPIGSFQAIAVRAADAYIETELLRSAVWQLAWRLDQGLPALAAARVAKHQAAQAGHIVGHTAQHFHGGVGADRQYPIHRFFLESSALELVAGGAQAQLSRIAAALAAEEFEEYLHG